MHLTQKTVARLLAITAIALLGADEADRAAQLTKLETNVFTADVAKSKQLEQMVARDIRSRIHAAHQREADAFAQLQSKADWEKFRETRLRALADSLGPFPPTPKEVKVHVTRTFKGEGYLRDDIVFESRPGLFVTGNLYRPAEALKAMPGILIAHGFHQPKTQVELQDMGVNWARLGCVVLVIDQLGHGERRQHPFVDAKSYPEKFALSRQDYYGRANAGLQLDLVGESLMGWMVQDMMRSVDVLLARPGVARDKIIVLGAVAAGGDTAAVTAALDPRIAAGAVFNFGGPEPETIYPLPADADRMFPYASGGHWDSTRRLRLSARDGFLPWLVLGATAPRRLIYGHEFAWDKDHDPVWPRLQKIFDFNNASDRLDSAHGSGSLFGNPEGTGCANIGPVHRQAIYPTLKRWFGLPIPDPERFDHRPPAEMQCLTGDAPRPKRVHELAATIGAGNLDAYRKTLTALQLPDRRKKMQIDWKKLLGEVEPATPKLLTAESSKLRDITIERIALETEPGIVVPMVLLLPARKNDVRLPVVIGFAQQGKKAFLNQRAKEIAELLAAGVAVCLPDVRGIGETQATGDLRGPPAGPLKGVEKTSNGTLLANEDLMLGRTLLGDRLRDLRSVLKYLRTRNDLDTWRLALWGDSFAPANAVDTRVEVPWDAPKLPAQSEPLGGILALLGALYEDDVKAIYTNGGLTGYQSLLEKPFCHVPHDVIVRGALTAGDLCDIAAALAPRALWLNQMVDGVNRRVAIETAGKTYEPARLEFRQAKASERFAIGGEEGKVANWLVAELKK